MGICDGPAAEHPDYLMWEQKTEEWLQNVTDTNSNMYINLLSVLDLSNIHLIVHVH